MRCPTRAGLVAIFFLALAQVLITAAAPLPTTKACHTSLSLTSADPRAVVQQPFSSIEASPACKNQLASISQNDGMAGREFVVLVRRKSIFTKIRDAFRKVGHKIKSGFQKLGHKIKSGFQKLGRGIKKVAQKIGHGIKVAAKKVGHFIKTTGAKIAKVGLKIISTVGKVVGKVVSFIPGVGKIVGKAVDGISEGLNIASNKIHAKIGGKLGKAMAGMDKAQKITSYVPRELSEDYEEVVLREYYARDWDDYDY